MQNCQRGGESGFNSLDTKKKQLPLFQISIKQDIDTDTHTDTHTHICRDEKGHLPINPIKLISSDLELLRKDTEKREEGKWKDYAKGNLGTMGFGDNL